MLRLTDLAHRLVREVLSTGDWAVDATVGNGHDTARLAAAVGATGHVIGFDVQAAALKEARRRLGDAANVTLHQASHDQLAAHLPPDARHHLKAVMFNLGYLPGADKAIMTKPETTIAALRQACAHLLVGGRITVMLYSGHAGGAEESAAVRAFAAVLPATFNVMHMARLNAAAEVPELVLIERVR